MTNDKLIRVHRDEPGPRALWDHGFADWQVSCLAFPRLELADLSWSPVICHAPDHGRGASINE
jgi:hypothetical protein